MNEKKIENRRCKRGLWDNSVPGIFFDNSGVSNYAKLFDNLCEAYPRGKEGLEKWNKIVELIKLKGTGKKYNCIIGVSGGTDSSYLLHLANEYKLKPLAVNLDNGWNSIIAVKNIKKMTKALNIDLETYVIDYEEIKDLLRSYMLASLPWIDIPTDLAIKSVLYRIAAREGIAYVLRGNDFRSEGSQPNEWTYGDGRQLKSIHRLYGRVKLKTYPNYTLTNLFFYGLIKRIKSVYPFYYLDYNKNKTQEFLKTKYDWEYYGGHHHENYFTKFSISYWMFEKFGIDKRLITLSAQVLSGEISREYSLEKISEPAYELETKDEMINYVIKKLDLNKEEFSAIMESKNKSFKDYPSYDFLFTNLLRFSAPLLSLIFLHKPQSIFQYEIRNKESK